MFKYSLLIVLCIGLLFNKVFKIELNKWDPLISYRTYGTALSFINDIIESKIQEPVGYSTNKVKNIMSNLDLSAPKKITTDKQPNIIVIMNEAFSDLSIINSFPTSENYMPFFQSLKNDTIKGNLLVSIYGGATCNTEFEFLTGNSMAFLPQGSIPYQQYIKEELDTIGTTLRSQNYTTTGIHPYGKYGYSRNLVYPLLGLDTFYSFEDFSNPKLLRDIITDKESFNKITQVSQQNNKSSNFIFNVTMQNHGGYSGEADLENWIYLTDNNVNFKDVEEYLTLIHASDVALEELITHYKNIDEPTLILMFGDHQPALQEEFYDYLNANKDTASIEQQFKKYMVPFILWANYDIEEKDNEMLSANYLSSYLLNVADIEMSQYNKYLLKLQDIVPAINAFGYLGNDSKWYDIKSESKYTEYLRDYQYIQYNNMFDKNGRIDDFFKISN